jgi:D-alanine--poly(phosphoribitol) ligase subunit 1
MIQSYEYNLGIRFQNIAEQYSSQTALWFNERDQVRYGELNRWANRMAHWLIDQGLGPGDVISISGIKSVRTFAAILACLKTGVAYSIIDPDSPVERLHKILSTCRPKLLLASLALISKLKQAIADLAIVQVDMDAERLGPAVQGYADTDLPQTKAITGTNPSYIMYTSGSTGFPKGALMTHGNVLNLIDWSRQTYEITPADILTNVNPMYFDNAVFDFYSALFNGACLVPFSKEETRDPRLLVDKVNAAHCTLWFSVPSLLIFLQTMKAMDGKNLRSIRRIVFGGEGYPKAKLKELFDIYHTTSKFFNVYGPTECTCICSSYQLSEEDLQDLQGFPPLGYIAPNFGYLILADDGTETPVGERGELCLMGPNVGRGYYNDPARTANAFVQNPCNANYPELIYKTGDLVSLNPTDGKLYIFGRKDNQIKHMGYRIELEEIEAALYCLDYVSEAVALHSSAGGLSRIVAVVAAHRDFTDEQIRRDLRQIISDYMIPSAYYREKVLPKNANGKVDRRQLAEKYAPSPAG